MKVNPRNTPIQLLAGVSALGALASGCSSANDPPVTSDDGSHFQLVVAPWEVDSRADYACFAITVNDAGGGLVWEDDSICTDDFSFLSSGNLGYVGVCDAGAGPGPSINSVSISLMRLVGDDGTELGNWGDDPPTFQDDFPCTANADAVVRAAFVVLAPGTKGFLDISVKVDEIECNAKIDCRDDFLTSGPDAGPQGTLILALTCDSENLFMDDVILRCLDAQNTPVTVTVDPGEGPGFHGGYPEEFVFGVSSTFGVSSDGQSSFWHMLVGVNPGWRDCTISARMTASNGDFGANNTYPTIVAREVPFSFDADGAFACVHPLDGDDSGLGTDWDPNVNYDNCLTPNDSTPDPTDVIVADCEGPPDPQGECPPGQTDPDLDGVCTDADTCTYPHWWWRSHYDGAVPESSNMNWPAPADESTLLCGLTWINIIRARGGDTWFILAQECISSRLNLANGAWAPPDVKAVIAASEATLLANCTRVPDAERFPALELSGILRGYNEGAVGPGHCPTVD